MIHRRFLGVQLLAAATLLTACSGGTDEAKLGVSEFRARVAHGAFAEIHRAATPEFQQAVSEEQFKRFMAALERKVGTWRSAKDPVWNITRGTGGHFVSLTYESEFSKGPVTEQFSWRIERGSAVLVGYNVKSSILVME